MDEYYLFKTLKSCNLGSNGSDKSYFVCAQLSREYKSSVKIIHLVDTYTEKNIL